MLEETLEVCRLVYNSFLGWRKHDYGTYGVAPDYSIQALALTRWKPHHPELCQIHSQVLQNVAKRVASTYEDFFHRVRTGEKFGFPRFKGSRQYNSFTYPQSGFKVGQQSVHLFMFSRRCQIKARIHRPVDGEIKTCTIHRANHKWYVCLHVEVNPKPLPPLATAVGVDVGLKHSPPCLTASLSRTPASSAKTRRLWQRPRAGSPITSVIPGRDGKPAKLSLASMSASAAADMILCIRRHESWSSASDSSPSKS